MLKLRFLHLGQNASFGHCFLRIKLRQDSSELYRLMSLSSFIPLNGTVSDVFLQDKLVSYELYIYIKFAI